MLSEKKKNGRLIFICKYGAGILVLCSIFISYYQLIDVAPLLVPTFVLGTANAGFIGMIVSMVRTGKVKTKGAKKRRRKILPLIYCK
jgi:hypothetical protein